MNRLFSALHKIDHTGKRTPTLNLAIPKFVVDEQALTDLDRQTIELVLDKLEFLTTATRERVEQKRGGK